MIGLESAAIKYTYYFKMVKLGSLLLLLLAAALLGASQAEPEPPFPLPFDTLMQNFFRAHVISEIVTTQGAHAHRIVEEIVDLQIGKTALVQSSLAGNKVVHCDGRLVYEYEPYKCRLLKPEDVQVFGQSDAGLWRTRVAVPDDSSSSPQDDELATTRQNKYRMMPLFGVIALWLNAAAAAKTYSKSEIVYSVSMDVHRKAHQWSFVSQDYNERVDMYFVDISAPGDTHASAGLSLEMIKITPTSSDSTAVTVNIIGMQFAITDDSYYDTFLQIPAGYGCRALAGREQTRALLDELPSIETMYFGPLLSHSHRIELELTATKYTQTNDDTKRASDTSVVELARTDVGDFVGGGLLQLVRVRDSSRDLKTITDYHMNVEYAVDARKGTCDMRNIAKLRRAASGDAQRQIETFSLKFANGLELSLDSSQIEHLFVATGEFAFVKRVRQGASSSELIYFERQDAQNECLLFPGRKCRTIRVYARDPTRSAQVDLSSVTIWVLDASESRIVESYHMNVIDAHELLESHELARVFDTSDECYLDAADKRAGKHYAWFQLNYPLLRAHADALAGQLNDFKEMVYERFLLKGHLSFFRLPKLELLFEDSGVVLRALLLDLPPLELVYEPEAGVKLELDSDKGDQLDLTVDLAHCADLCKFYKCKTMSFCATEHKCLLSADLPAAAAAAASGRLKLLKDVACTTYTQPQLCTHLNLNDASPDAPQMCAGDELWQLSLQRVLASMQYQDYGAVALPERPEELRVGQQDSGLDDDAYGALVREYYTKLFDFLDEDEHKLPMLTFAMKFGPEFDVLLPDRFELEQDPLLEAAQQDDDDDDAQQTTSAAFHQGLNMHHYKVNALSQAAAAAVKRSSWRLFNGLSYDQCALACADSSCSSFSYCTHRRECIVTEIYELSKSADLMEMDVECFIVQRDFVSKFNKFDNTHRPQLYKRSTAAISAAECAHACVVATDFRCLAFDFCVADDNNNKLDGCFLLEDRRLYTGGATTNTDNDKSAVSTRRQTSCAHYSRSYLADFLRVESRKFDDTQLLAKAKTSIVSGRSVDACAEHCATGLIDCSAFQFCLDASAASEARAPMQSCTMLEGHLSGQRVDQAPIVSVDDAQQDQAPTNNLLQPSADCHVFLLRKDSSEAQLRELALVGMTKAEYEAQKRLASDSRPRGLTLAGAVLLFLGVTSFVATIAFGFTWARENNDFVRAKMERMQIILNTYGR